MDARQVVGQGVVVVVDGDDPSGVGPAHQGGHGEGGAGDDVGEVLSAGGHHQVDLGKEFVQGVGLEFQVDAGVVLQVLGIFVGLPVLDGGGLGDAEGQGGGFLYNGKGAGVVIVVLLRRARTRQRTRGRTRRALRKWKACFRIRRKPGPSGRKGQGRVLSVS